MRISIRQNLIVVYLIIISVIIAWAFYALHVTRKIYIEEIGRNSQLVAEEMIKRMNQRLFHIIGQVKIAAKSKIAQDSFATSNLYFLSLPSPMEFIQKNDREWISSPEEEITPFMKDLMINDLAHHFREIFIEGFEKEYGFSIIQEIIITNKYGANIAISGKTTDYNQGDENWWQETRSKGIYIGDIEFDDSISAYGIDAAVRIDDEHGNFVGVALINLNVRAIVREAEVGTHKYQSTQIQIITSDGKLVFSTKPHKFMSDAPYDHSFINELKQEGHIISENGARRIFSSTPSGGYKFFRGFNWNLIISHGLDEVLAPYYSLQKRIIIIFSALFLFCTLLLLLLGKRITDPIKAFMQTVKEIGKGNLTARVNVGGDDELSDLAYAFNYMVDRRQQAENYLKESESRFRAIFEQAAVGVAQIEIESGQFVRVNRKFCDIVGYTADEMLQLTFTEITHPDDLQTDLDNLNRLISGEVHEYSIGKRYYHKDGSVVWGNLTVSRMWKTGEEPEFYIAILEDITFRKRAEESLHFTQFAVDRASDFAFWINPDGSFSYVNDTACKWLGYSRKDLLNMLFFDIAPYITPDKWAKHWQEVKAKKSFIFETNFRSAEGSFFPVEVVVNYTEFEGKAYNCAFVRDITERKISEEEKVKIEKQLRQAQKMEAIGTLAGGIAHDFNNILSVILGYTDIAKREVPPGSTLEDNLDEILQAGLRAKDLVKQILAFSRQAEVDRIQIQPSVLLKEAVKLLRSSIPVTIEIHEDIDSETGIIFADPTQIHQVVLNLITNAFHAMEETGGKLGVTLREVEFGSKDIGTEPGVEPGDFIHLSVTDTGPGIPPEIRENIFDPYFTTKEKGKGTGMGLAIVHGIVKSYGGFITIESNPGKGSTFSVFLPSVQKQILDEKSALEEIPRGNERILFIDDEEILADMGKYMLETLGYDPTVKNDSYAAFEAFRDDPNYFDLIITDQTMPGMTGAELSKKILKIRPDIPIILCTGYSAIISEAKAKAIGIREFALKPLTIKDVAILIRKVLDEKPEKAAT